MPSEAATLRFLVILAGVGLGAAIAYAVWVKGPSRGAFNRWRPALHGLMAGDNIYQRHAFPTPPIMALILYPFATIPKPFGALFWALGSASLAIAGILMLTTRVHRAFGAQAVWPPFAALALSLGPMTGDIVHGNVNLLIFGLTAAAIAWVLDGRPIAAGIAASLAAACKLTPILLPAYFAWKRLWTALAASLTGLFLWLFLLPGAVLGFDRNAELLASWRDLMVRPFLADGAVETEHINQSLPGLIHRLLTPAVAIHSEAGHSPTSVTLFDFGRRYAEWATTGVIACALAAMAALMRKPWKNTHDVSRIHELSLILLAMLLLSERSWKHYYGTIYLPCLSIGLMICRARRSPMNRHSTWDRFVGASSLAIAAVGIVGSSTDLIGLFTGARTAKLLQSYGSYVWAALALAAAHMIALTWRGRSPEVQRNSTGSFDGLTWRLLH